MMFSNPAWRGRSFAPCSALRVGGISIIRACRSCSAKSSRPCSVRSWRRRHLRAAGCDPQDRRSRLARGCSILPSMAKPASRAKSSVHTEGPAEGKVHLKLPEGWTATPAEAGASAAKSTATPLRSALLFEGQAAKLEFRTPPSPSRPKPIQAATPTRAGWQRVGYLGLRPYKAIRN